MIIRVVKENISDITIRFVLMLEGTKGILLNHYRFVSNLHSVIVIF